MSIRGKKRDIAKLAPPDNAWERQPDEPDGAWEAFVIYRDMGPGHRAIRKTAAQLSKNETTMYEWSQRWDWVARCRAFDGYVDRQRVEAEISAVRDMRRRHIEMSMAVQGAAALALNKIIAAEKEKKDLGLKPSEVRDFIDLGLKIERINRGEPEAIVHNTATSEAPPVQVKATIVHDYSRLSLDEMRTMRDLTRKAKGDAK